MTPLQRQVLEAIRRLTFDGVSPSYEDIQRECGLSSKSHVHRLVHGLRDRGVIDLKRGCARSIVIIGDEFPAAERIADSVARWFSVPVDEALGAVLRGLDQT